MVNLVYYCRLTHCQFCKHCCNSKICIRRASCRSLLWSLGTARRNVEFLSMQACRCHTGGTRAKWGTYIAVIHFSPLEFTPSVWPWQCKGAHICHTGLQACPAAHVSADGPVLERQYKLPLNKAILRIKVLLAYVLNTVKENMGLRNADLNLIRTEIHCLVTMTVPVNNRETD